MPEVLEKLKGKIFDFWSALDKNQKTRLFISLGLLLVGIAVIGYFSFKTNYVELLEVKNPKDIQEIEKALKDKNIPYKAGENGKILVDSKLKNDATFAVASVPGLSSSVSFKDSWEMIKMSSTESDKKKLWQDFKKNSLVAQIKMFDNVQDADVEIAIPEKTMYFTNTEQEKPTAWVRIKPKGEISPDQVQGIVSIVSASIEGLDPKNVKVVDNNFNLLTQEMGDSDIERTGTQYKMRLKVKTEMENNVKKLYSGVSDNFDYINVVANPVLDFNKEKVFDSDVRKPTDIDEAVVSTQSSKETLQNGTQGQQPGMGTNPGNTAPTYPITEGGNSDYQKQSTTQNYDYRRVQRETEKALGNVDYENSTMSVTLWFGQRVTDENKLNDQFIEQFRNGVSLATGVPAAKISVNKYKLAPTVETQPSIAEKAKSLVDAYGLFALLLLTAVGLIFVMPKPKKVVVEEQNLQEGDGSVMGEKDKLEEEIAAKEEDETSKMIKEIEDFIRRRPESVANLLRNWLQDEWS